MTASRAGGRGDAVASSARRHWIRWWATACLVGLCLTALPAAIWFAAQYDLHLRATTPISRVLVVDVRAEPDDPDLVSITVRVPAGDVHVEPWWTPARVGDLVDVVIDPTDGQYVLAAEDPFAEQNARDDPVFGALLATGMVVLLGWGPGMPPRPAIRAMRTSARQRQTVCIVAATRSRAPQGVVYDQWRKLRDTSFWDVTLLLEDGTELLWRGHLYDAPVIDSPAHLVGSAEPDGWAVLTPGADVRSTRVNWPAVRLQHKE